LREALCVIVTRVNLYEVLRTSKHLVGDVHRPGASLAASARRGRRAASSLREVHAAPLRRPAKDRSTQRAARHGFARAEQPGAPPSGLRWAAEGESEMPSSSADIYQAARELSAVCTKPKSASSAQATRQPRAAFLPLAKGSRTRAGRCVVAISSALTIAPRVVGAIDLAGAIGSSALDARTSRSSASA
jgi:hypothetical protein